MHSMHHSCYDCERLAHVLLPSGRWAMACVTNLDEHERHGRKLDVECIDFPRNECDEWEEER